MSGSDVCQTCNGTGYVDKGSIYKGRKWLWDCIDCILVRQPDGSIKRTAISAIKEDEVDAPDGRTRPSP